MQTAAASFPRFYAAASLKLERLADAERHSHGFPRFYAAASLKHDGIIPVIKDIGRFPRFYAAASLKRVVYAMQDGDQSRVFRGSMPRPH